MFFSPEYQSCIKDLLKTKEVLLIYPIVRRQIHRIRENGLSQEVLEDEIIQESQLTIILDGQKYLRVMLLPWMLEEFILGFLLTRRLVNRTEDIESLEIEPGEAKITRVPELRARISSPGTLESTGTQNIDFEMELPSTTEVSSKLTVCAEVLTKGVRRLSDMDLFRRTGGTHCAILYSPEGESLASAEDIGRHNSVDKSIGGGLKRGVNFSRSWLAVSGRLPADMIFKAVIVGIPLIASISAPTSNGIEVGDRAGVTVIGFTRGGGFNCYCHPERVL